MLKPYIIFGVFAYLARRQERLVNANELADKFEVCTRTINRYMEELEYVGVNVETKRGVGGGYRITTDKALDSFLLNKDELHTVKSALNGEEFDKEFAKKIIKKL